MSVARRALLGAALLLVASPALAHPPPLGIPGFPGGALHPVFVPAHLLAIVGVGFALGQLAAGSRPAVLSYIVALVAGLGLIALGFVPRLAGEALLILAGVAGGLVALARPLPRPAACVLAGCAGLAIGLDSPPEVVSVREANWMLIGTGFGATVTLIVVVEIASRLTRPVLRTGARILGSWVAASAILVLALGVARY
jgi:urease accessory protein